LRVEVSLNGGAGAAAPAPPLRPADAAGVSIGASSTPAAAPDPAPALTAAAADSPPPQPLARGSIVADRQALYADPVVRRIFEELQGRLVEVRERPTAASAAPAEAPAADGVLVSSDPAPRAIRRPSQE
jgi:hypothetical protein